MTRNTILRIARAGNPARAMSLFVAQGMDAIRDDAAVLTLKGRLLKDQARLCDGEERARFYTQSLETYLAAYALEPTSYALINAATLAFEAGLLVRSRELAQHVLDMLDANPDEGETPYWREATRAEALLLLERTRDARAALRSAIDSQPLAHEDQAATIGQFEWIVHAQGGNPSWLDDCRPPASVHFSGLIGLDADDPALLDRVTTAMADVRPGYAFGALAAGADILLAEAALEHGAQLHVVLPCDARAFRALSVEPYGSHWAARFDRLADGAEMVEAVADLPDRSPHAFAAQVELASLVAMGQCLRRADILRSKALGITIAAPGEEERRHIGHWRATGRPLERIETVRVPTGGQGEVVSGPFALTTIVLVAGGDAAQLGALAQEYRMRAAASGEGAGAGEGGVLTGSPRDALHFLRAWSGSAAPGRASFVTLAMDGEAPCPCPEAIGRAQLLLRVAEDGQITSERHSAFAAKALMPDVLIEEAGEIASLEGPVSLWTARL